MSSAAATPLDSLDGLRLNRALRAGIARLLSRQEYLNKINVFPVPDGDTGTNLALTATAMLGALQRVPDAHAGRTLTAVADAALDGARGNSGAILAQFFLGVCDRVGEHDRLSAGDLVDGLQAGAAYARESLTEPHDGTILSVLRDHAHGAQAAYAGGAREFAPLLERALAAAQAALERTRTELEAMRRANVVDAGAQGFVELVSGMSDYLLSGRDDEPDVAALAAEDTSAIAAAGAEQDLDYRWCTECVVSGPGVDLRRLRERLAALGGSVAVAGLAGKLRVHIHVNDPAEVYRIAAEFGRVDAQKADDMQRQQHAAHARDRRIAIVTDSAADIPDEEMDRLDIHMVPVRVHFGERSFLDKVGITPAEFFAELARSPEHPTTSQPPPGDFRRQFEFLASHFDSVLSVNVTREVSGTCAAAEGAAARTAAHDKITVVDSGNASTGQGLIAMYAAECARAGQDFDAVVAATRAICERTRTFGLVGSLEYALRGGRVPRWIKRVADALRLMPVLCNDAAGRIGASGILFGRSRLREKFARHIERRMDDGSTYRILVGHANNEGDAHWLLERLRRPNVVSGWVVPMGSALGVHGGPGMLVVGVQEYDRPNDNTKHRNGPGPHPES
jgi:DegV family protein with EDD domain